jgi:ADP-L-glycero-D-manno-heptose 6-epimerase
MYIVTGGAGLIGSAIVWELNNRGFKDILVVDHLGHSDKWRNLRALKFQDYMEKDVFRKSISENKIKPKGIRAIIHMGACSKTTERDAGYLIDNNYNYSRELASFAVSNKIRFLYASSAATYGDGSRGYIDDESALDSLRPLNIYGYSKHMFDLWARNNGLLDRITGFKFTNIYGPNEWHKDDMRSVVCKAYEQIVSTGKVQLFKSCNPDYKDGEQKRDFLYVKDAVDMVLFFLDRKESGLFNIGSGHAETWKSLVAAIFAALNKKPNIEYIEMPEYLIPRYQYYTKAEMWKLNRFHSQQLTPLKDSVKDYVKNYLVPARHLGD